MKYTPESFARWLQAGPVPFFWFLEQSETDQQSMSEQGAIHRVDGYIELAQAIQDPALFEAQTYAESDPEAAEYLVRRLADQHAAALAEEPHNGSYVTRSTPVRSMDQAMEDCETDDQEVSAARVEKLTGDKKTARFMGMAPDKVTEVVET